MLVCGLPKLLLPPLPSQCGSCPCVDGCAGKGRGLVATRPIRAGELLLVDTPAVFLESCSEGDIPELEDLEHK